MTLCTENSTLKIWYVLHTLYGPVGAHLISLVTDVRLTKKMSPLLPSQEILPKDLKMI